MMPRNMSFFHTQKQFKNQTKTVTRRTGWKFLKVGDILNGCEKCQGLKKGERIKKLGQIRVTDVYDEPLNQISQTDCIAEGFPDMTPSQFVEFFRKVSKCGHDEIVTRIEFEYWQKGCLDILQHPY